ncbi:MAG: SDR family oxidoreductase [Rickettsiales bacterium]
MRRLEGKIALITGGSRGIGAETARVFAKEGAKVIVADILEKEGKEIAKDITGKFYKLDVSKESSWKQLFSSIIDDFGRLDILFNNAGITGLSDKFSSQIPEEISIDTWKKIHQINLESVVLGCKYGIKLMKKNGGSIINMSSRSGTMGVPAASAYASSKAAIINYTKSVAIYCAEQKYKIRCNSILPGAVLTPIWHDMAGYTKTPQDEMIKGIASTIPLGHMGEPVDIAMAALYFASDESKYTTGAEISVDGGILAGSGAKPKLE